MNRTLFIAALVGTALGMGVVGAQAADIYTSNFAGGGGSYATYSAGQSFDGWQVTSGSVDLIGGYWQAPTGSVGSVDLDGNSPGAISKDLGVLKQGSYVVSFSLSGNPDGGTNKKSVELDITKTNVHGGGSDVFKTFLYNTNKEGTAKTNMDYITESFAFSTNGNKDIMLSFISKDASGPYGAVIGDVKVSAVPVPAALPMFGAALLGLGGLARRRAKKAA